MIAIYIGLTVFFVVKPNLPVKYPFGDQSTGWNYISSCLCVLLMFVSFFVAVATSHFAATPQSDVVRICAHDFQRNGDAIGTTENACFRAFIIDQSQFHLHYCSQGTLTEIVSKITRNLGLVL